jgi:hypothetical protein
MAKLVSSPWFQVVFVPLLLMMLGVFARRLGRRDGDDSPHRNDWAVGTTVLLMLLGTVVGDIRSGETKVPLLLMWLVGVLFTAFLSIDHDRYRSWERDEQGLPMRVKRLWVGVVFQNILCVGIFGAYQAWKVDLI